MGRVLVVCGVAAFLLGCTSATPTDLYKSVEQNRLGEVKELLNAGVSVDEEDEHHHSTPLFAAAHEGFTEIARLLIEKGADVNYNTPTGRLSVLHAAAAHGHTEIVQMLIAKEVKLNVLNGDQHTPLQLSMLHSHWDVVEALQDAGAKEELGLDDLEYSHEEVHRAHIEHHKHHEDHLHDELPEGFHEENSGHMSDAEHDAHFDQHEDDHYHTDFNHEAEHEDHAGGEEYTPDEPAEELEHDEM